MNNSKQELLSLPLMQQILNHELLSEKETQKLIAEYQETGNKEARDRVALSNQRLVKSIAWRHLHEFSFLTIGELLDEGNVGLLKAINRFNKSKSRGGKFSTYASWWIRQAITREIQRKSRTIRIPVHAQEALNIFRKEVGILTKKLKRLPSPKEIAVGTGFSLEQIYHFEKIIQDTISLDIPIGDKSDTLVNFISDDTINPPDEPLQGRQLSEKLSDILSRLTPKERRIIEMRYGFGDGIEYTLEKVGIEFNVTRESIRQVQEKVEKRLKKIIKNEFEELIPE